MSSKMSPNSPTCYMITDTSPEQYDQATGTNVVNYQNIWNNCKKDQHEDKFTSVKGMISILEYYYKNLYLYGTKVQSLIKTMLSEFNVANQHYSDYKSKVQGKTSDTIILSNNL